MKTGASTGTHAPICAALGCDPAELRMLAHQRWRNSKQQHRAPKGCHCCVQAVYVLKQRCSATAGACENDKDGPAASDDVGMCACAGATARSTAKLGALPSTLRWHWPCPLQDALPWCHPWGSPAASWQLACPLCPCPVVHGYAASLLRSGARHLRAAAQTRGFLASPLVSAPCAESSQWAALGSGTMSTGSCVGRLSLPTRA